MYDAEKHLVKLLLKESENVVAKLQSEIESEILDSETYKVTLECLEQKHAKFKQNLEKQRDKKRRKFQQNVIKEQHGQKSQADTGYRKATKVESILSGPKLEPRVMVDRNKNSEDVSKIKNNRPLSAVITPSKNKNTTDNQNFRKKKSKMYAEDIAKYWNIKL